MIIKFKGVEYSSFAEAYVAAEHYRNLNTVEVNDECYAMVMRSFYLKGADGDVNLVYRPKGTKVEYVNRYGLDTYEEINPVYIVGFGVQPQADSTYYALRFDTYREALAYFEAEEARNG